MTRTQNQKISWAVAGTVLATILGAIAVNFWVIPARERQKARDEVVTKMAIMELRVSNLETWQNDMQKWKERMLVRGGGSIAFRSAVADMPSLQPIDSVR